MSCKFKCQNLGKFDGYNFNMACQTSKFQFKTIKLSLESWKTEVNAKFLVGNPNMLNDGEHTLQ